MTAWRSSRSCWEANQGQMPAEGEIRVEVDAKEFAARIGGSCDGDVDHGDPCVGFIVVVGGGEEQGLSFGGRQRHPICCTPCHMIKSTACWVVLANSAAVRPIATTGRSDVEGLRAVSPCLGDRCEPDWLRIRRPQAAFIYQACADRQRDAWSCRRSNRPYWLPGGGRFRAASPRHLFHFADW